MNTPAPLRFQESPLDPRFAVLRSVVPAGEPWAGLIRRGQTFRIVDLEGNQSADTIFYAADRQGKIDPHERYSATDTLLAQRSLYLTTGSLLYSNQGRVLLTITADTCGRHDTIGGACSCESNSVRYPRSTQHMHSCRDTFLRGLRENHPELTKRDLPPNINFFMNVPVSPDGKMTFADGVSGPGKYVEMRAETDVVVLISNCPQLNNPCNAYNPTPLEVLLWD
jgi:urea carboxylase-associated protein 1